MPCLSVVCLNFEHSTANPQRDRALTRAKILPPLSPSPPRAGLFSNLPMAETFS